MGIREKLLERIRSEIVPLERELKIELPRQLAEAAAHGDLSENAEYDAAKERKEMVQNRLADLYRRKAAVSNINPEMIPHDTIGFWSRVELMDLDSGDEVTYLLVTADEADPPRGRISLTSPIGKALVGHRPGDEVTVRTPRGERSYEVLDFTSLHDQAEPD